MTKYKPTKDALDTKSIKSFVQDVLDGKVKVVIQSLSTFGAIFVLVKRAD